MSTRFSSSALTRTEARKAVLGVKKARSTSAKKASSAAKKASSWSVKRYLGHFGVGPESAESTTRRPAKKGATKKKTTARKTSGAKKRIRVR